MKTVKAVIDASNLRVGGGVQVASSFVAEVRCLDAFDDFPWLSETRIFVSPEVASTLPDSVIDDDRIAVRVTTPRSPRPSVNLNCRAVWFDIFGGTVQRKVGAKRMVGFADVTSIYRQPLATLGESMRLKLRSRIGLRSFRSADLIVVETEAVRDRLVQRGFSPVNVSIVPNCYHPAFDVNPDSDSVAKWRRVLAEAAPGAVTLLYVARAYPHKNHDFLGSVGKELDGTTSTPVRFVVTLTDEEWLARSPDFRQHSVNVGPVDVHRLPALYCSVDAVIFPSLLECFSATPLEALRTGRPLIASDRDFVRAVVGPYARYFDPMDPQDAARTVKAFVASPDGDRVNVASGLRIAVEAPGSTARALRYLELMDRLRSEA